MCMQYNGWKNYQTWCVYNWASSSKGLYGLLRDVATDEQIETADAAEYVHDLFQVELYPLDGAGLFDDLLTSVLDKVDWHALVLAFAE
jgi:hypothetical protein